MKLISHFDDFLHEVVNINPTRLTLLENSVQAIKIFIRVSEWEPRILGFAEQGSWAHHTIIKPVEGGAFDADLLVFVETVEGWDAKRYVDELYKVFNGSGTYAGKVRRWSHCISITYAGERKIDIAPCLIGRGGSPIHEVCNRDANEFVQSEPNAYSKWIAERNTWSGRNNFRKVTRLMKYLRDIKGNFTCPSFLLTTLLGDQVRQNDSFSDVPTALKVLVGRLDDVLQAHARTPTVVNPVLRTEVLSGVWDETKYANFRNKVHQYRGWIDDAFDATERGDSIGKWRRVFGDEFAGAVAIEEAARVSETARELLLNTAANLHNIAGDLVSMVKSLGASALPRGFSRLAHMEQPKWRIASTGLLNVRVEATLHGSKHGPSVGTAQSLAPQLPGNWLRFDVRTRMGMPLPNTYLVNWRITNTDKTAKDAGALRGGFYASEGGTGRWESLTYRGVHMAEAFVVRRVDDALVAQSEPFYVVVE
jgi:hypothetical protein